MRRIVLWAIITVAWWTVATMLAQCVEAASKPANRQGRVVQAQQASKSKAESLGPIGVIRPPVDSRDPDAMADWRIVNPSYFSSVNVPFVKGRNFTSSDSKEAPRVAIVDENLAQRLWPGQEAVGRRLRIEGDESPWMTVIGVVRHHAGGTLEGATHGQLYFPYPESPNHGDDSDE